MKLTLPIIRSILRDHFGWESFVASFIKSVNENNTIPTACINQNGELLYNPEFVKKHVKTRQDLFCIVVHEMMHPMFGHFIHGSGMLENFGADMVINACISRVYSKASGEGSLFKRFYATEGLEALLRPASNMQHSRYLNLYEHFYEKSNPKPLSTGEVITALRVLCPVMPQEEITLLGSHQTVCGEASGTSIDQDTVRGFAEDLLQALQNEYGKWAGHGSTLQKMLVEVLCQHRSIKKRCLANYATRMKFDRFLVPEVQRILSISPIPLHPSKRDLVLLGAGHTPLHYRNSISHEGMKAMGLGIYLDVSGSVFEYLPEIIGLLLPFKHSIKSVYLFSNEVVETPLAKVLEGEVISTIGTDFDCIAKSILEQRLDRAVIFTDGYACMEHDLQEELMKKNVKTLCVLYGGKMDCPEFEPLGCKRRSRSEALNVAVEK